MSEKTTIQTTKKIKRAVRATAKVEKVHSYELVNELLPLALRHRVPLRQLAGKIK